MNTSVRTEDTDPDSIKAYVILMNNIGGNSSHCNIPHFIIVIAGLHLTISTLIMTVGTRSSDTEQCDIKKTD